MARIAVLDCFTSDIFRGNPAAVVLTAEPLSADRRISLAIELNQPATAFVSHPRLFEPAFTPSSHDAPLLIRWHTSTGGALPLCGHATMAASHFLLRHFLPPSVEQLEFEYPFLHDETATGRLLVRRVQGDRVEVTLPACLQWRDVSDDEREKVTAVMRAAAGTDSVQEVLAFPTPNPKVQNVVIRLQDHVDLAALEFKPEAFLKLPYRGIWVFNTIPPALQAALPGASARSRVFFPSVGIMEDHVCGSAHTALGPYLFSSSATPSTESLEFAQVSKRGGKIGITWDGRLGHEGGTVGLRGEARLLFQGELYL
ncbi:hypothetical protein Rhopal_002965-T1 [Rhodotorula paludigena]|uniref:Diaminopimelate epimerase-like protein n=1 Tax=Rhodotorula paludigena TaxID=86838 RepID=A0AAV5GBY4_9BASI|nr:hypothetical protein Rhopal_002965-T1 [Rhodotorula paludigena]